MDTGKKIDAVRAGIRLMSGAEGDFCLSLGEERQGQVKTYTLKAWIRSSSAEDGVAPGSEIYGLVAVDRRSAGEDSDYPGFDTMVDHLHAETMQKLARLARQAQAIVSGSFEGGGDQ